MSSFAAGAAEKTTHATKRKQPSQSCDNAAEHFTSEAEAEASTAAPEAPQAPEVELELEPQTKRAKNHSNHSNDPDACASAACAFVPVPQSQVTVDQLILDVIPTLGRAGRLDDLRAACLHPSLVRDSGAQTRCIENWWRLQKEVPDRVLRVLLNAWPDYAIQSLMPKMLAEPVVRLANGDRVIEGDLFITQSTFHNLSMREMGSYSASYDRGEFFVDAQGQSLFPAPNNELVLDVWATSREDFLFPTSGGFSSSSVERVRPNVIARREPDVALPSSPIATGTHFLCQWRADHDVARMLGKSDNWSAHGHPVLGRAFPAALPYSLLQGKKEEDVIEVRMLVTHTFSYDDKPSNDSLDDDAPEVCTLRLRCRQRGYRCDPLLDSNKFEDRLALWDEVASQQLEHMLSKRHKRDKASPMNS